MREFLEQLINRIREFWEQLDLTRRLGLLGAILVVILLVIFAIVWLSRDDFVTLYAGLSREDLAGAEIVLKQNAIDYKIDEKYSEILVPLDRYNEAQILIAEKGALSKGASALGSKYATSVGGYEILERGSLSLMSDKEFSEFRRQALEGEIAYTLASFEGVRNARVGLALPEHEIFVKDQKEASASVVLTLDSERFGSSKFEPRKVIPIMQKIVAYRVPDLQPENVQISDTEGRFDSSEFTKEETPSDEMSRHLQIVKEYERYFNKKAYQALNAFSERIASIEVKVDVDLTKKSILEEKFSPITQDEEGLIRSSLEERESFEGEGVLPGGVPGVDSNIPPEYMGTEIVGPSTYDRSKRIDNYEMNRTVTEEVTKPSYEIVSASILIDLSLEPNRESIRNIIAKTLGITDDKIAIESMSLPVKAVEVLKEAKPIWFRLIEMGIIALTVIAILLFLRSMIRRKEEVVEAPEISGLDIPAGMTVREYVDDQLEERVSLWEKEKADKEEQERELKIAREEAERQEKKRKEEEEARRKAEEEAKRKRDEEKQRIASERERRKEVLDVIKKYAKENPESIAEVLRVWLQPQESESKKTAEQSQSKSETQS